MAGVSLADVLMREGIHRETLLRQTPFTLGWDIVGTVDKIGEKLFTTSTWKIRYCGCGLANIWRICSISCAPLTSSDLFLPEWTTPKQLAWY